MQDESLIPTSSHRSRLRSIQISLRFTFRDHRNHFNARLQTEWTLRKGVSGDHLFREAVLTARSASRNGSISISQALSSLVLLVAACSCAAIVVAFLALFSYTRRDVAIMDLSKSMLRRTV